MKLVKPTIVTPAMLYSSNISEDDYEAWVGTTAYSQGDRRIVLATHKVYEALIANTNKYPPDSLSGTDPAWLEVGATNRWKMFDQSYHSQSSKQGDMQFVLKPGKVNTLGLLNVDASSIDITVTSEGVTYYDKTISTGTSATTGWYDYLFAPRERSVDFVFMDLPPVVNPEITITLIGTTATKCGLCIPGFQVVIGDSLWGTEIGMDDFSKKERDVFGNYSIVERDYSDKLTVPVLVSNSRVGYLRRLIAEYRAKPALWVASEKIEGAFIYGFRDSFDVVLESPAGSQCSLVINGLV